MLAPSYDILMDLEGQMATACANVFKQSGFDAPLTLQSSEEVKTPEYAFHFSSKGVADQHQQLVWSYKVYDHFIGDLDVIIFTTRSENTATELGIYRSRVRQVFNFWRGKFAAQDAIGNPLCPYYLILDIWDRGSSPTVQQDENQDKTAMHFEIKFAINPDSWPKMENQQMLVQSQQLH
jgi:hypothetical protein